MLSVEWWSCALVRVLFKVRAIQRAALKPHHTVLKVTDRKTLTHTLIVKRSMFQSPIYNQCSTRRQRVWNETGWKSSDSFNQSQLRRAIYMLPPKTRKLITFANERFFLNDEEIVSWLLCKSLNSSWQVSKSVKVLLNWKNFKMEIMHTFKNITWLTCNQIPVVSYIFKGFLQRKECCISQTYTAWSCSWQITQDYPLYCSPS